MKRSPTEIEADIRAIKDLSNSRGWALICEHLKDEVYRLSVAKSRNINATSRQSDMTDGAISATDGFLRVDQVVAIRLANEFALDAPPIEGAPDA